MGLGASAVANEAANTALKTALRNPSRVLIDVRSSAEFSARKIQGSLNLEKATKEGKLPKDTSVPIIAYCASGNRVRSAIPRLEAAGYQNVLNGVSIDLVDKLMKDIATEDRNKELGGIKVAATPKKEDS